MYPNPAPLSVTLGMIAIALSLLVGLSIATRAAAQRLGQSTGSIRALTRKVALGSALWFTGFGVLAGSGWLAHFERRPPPFALAMLAALGGAVLFARSSAGRVLAHGLPLSVLVGFQLFRVPLELTMHAAARAGVMPNQMSFSGWNFDIVSGLSAGALGLLLLRERAPRQLVLAWNLLGSTLLFAIIAIAVASTPMIHAFGDDALNTFVAYVPFVWLPSIMVPAALLGHLLVFSKLSATSQSTADVPVPVPVPSPDPKP